jgi:hypothetical protein
MRQRYAPICTPTDALTDRSAGPIAGIGRIVAEPAFVSDNCGERLFEHAHGPRPRSAASSSLYSAFHSSGIKYNAAAPIGPKVRKMPVALARNVMISSTGLRRSISACAVSACVFLINEASEDSAWSAASCFC